MQTCNTHEAKNSYLPRFVSLFMPPRSAMDELQHLIYFVWWDAPSSTATRLRHKFTIFSFHKLAPPLRALCLGRAFPRNPYIPFHETLQTIDIQSQSQTTFQWPLLTISSRFDSQDIPPFCATHTSAKLHPISSPWLLYVTLQQEEYSISWKRA